MLFVVGGDGKGGLFGCAEPGDLVGAEREEAVAEVDEKRVAIVGRWISNAFRELSELSDVIKLSVMTGEAAEACQGLLQVLFIKVVVFLDII